MLCEDLKLLPDYLLFEDDLPVLDELRKSRPSIPVPEAVLPKRLRRKAHRERQQNALRLWFKKHY